MSSGASVPLKSLDSGFNPVQGGFARLSIAENVPGVGPGQDPCCSPLEIGVVLRATWLTKPIHKWKHYGVINYGYV